jgi:hypothetical protein
VRLVERIHRTFRPAFTLARCSATASLHGARIHT